MADGRAALEEARRLWPGARVVLHGHSLGTAVAVAADAGDEVAAVYLEAPFSSVAAMAARRFFGVPFGPVVRGSLPSIDLMGRIRAPVFIVHGSRDGVIPPSESALLAAADHGVDRRIVDADHVSRLARNILILTGFLIAINVGGAERRFRLALPIADIIGFFRLDVNLKVYQ